MRKLLLALALLWPFAALAQPVNQPVGPPITCNKSVSYSSSAAGTTQLVALATGTQIYVCGWDMQVASGATVQLEYGTGSSCGTGTTVITPAFAPVGQFNDNSPFFRGLSTVAGTALCLVQTGAFAVTALIYYGQY